MAAMDRFEVNVREVLANAFTQQREKMQDVALRMCDCVTGGGMLYVFGTGHAHMLAEELFYRAGGLAAVTPILEERLMLHVSASRSSQVEREHGYAEDLLKRYPMKQGDMLIVCSNSGRNAVPVELAMLARERGATVVALTNVRHSQSCEPRNQMKRRLMEVSDVVLDNFGCVGDASVEMTDGRRVGATSTVVGAAILEAIVCQCVELALELGKMIDVFASSNVDEGDNINEVILEKYRPRIKFL